MIRYLIKATYLEGPHCGESYLLRKGGFVTDFPSIQWDDTTYKTEGICKRVCKHMFEENELNRRIERREEQWKIQKGGQPKKWYIYESQKYEPYAVDVVE